MSTKKKALLLLLTATFIWGVSSPINRYALQSMHPWPFSAFRYFFGALALLPLAIRWGHRQAPAQYFYQKVGRFLWLKAGLTLGFLLALGTGLQMFGLSVTTASKSGFITSLYVPLVAIFVFVLGQLPRGKVWFGLAICVVGLLFIGNQGEENGFNWGDALTLVADLVWATHMLFMGYFAVRVNTWRLVASQAGVCFLLCLFMANATGTMCTWEEFWSTLPELVWGVFSVSLAYVCQAMAQINTPTTTTAITLQFQPVLGAVCGVLFLNEPVTGGLIFGAILLISGALVAQRAEDPVKLTKEHKHYKGICAARVAAAVLVATICGLSLLLTYPKTF
ncbi:MAG: DMT family transporter [Deltaproteobacteria bacterium]|jgi:drug/metabolite transporter (DMT)-like permease|nr:DMT family transporter [Deltaproteobacteria bacterium]